MAVIQIKTELALAAMNQDALDLTLGNAIYGFNTDFTKRYLHPSRNNQGLCFFVRPQFNLSDDNIRHHRLLYGNLESEDFGIPSFVRHTLDPRLARQTSLNIINNNQAFIPIMSNTLNTLSGFPDIELPTASTDPGLANEVYTTPDGPTDIYGPVDISASFANTTGEPMLALMHTWVTATSLLRQGKIRPYSDFISEHERCFDTRLFRLILDQTGQYVRRIAATGPGFIDNVGMGAGYDYNREVHYVEGDDSHSFRFKFAGVEYRDPILVYEFNKIGEVFQPLLADGIREKHMQVIPLNSRHLANYTGYPRIDTKTMKFDYWVENYVVEELFLDYKDYDAAVGTNIRSGDATDD